MTVTVTTLAGPAQLIAEGVMVYATFPTTAFVVFNNCDIVEPFPSVAPVTFEEADAVHENVVPDTFLGEGRIVTLAVSPLQIVMSETEAEGSGFTVTT